ncbi:DNA mismatch repair protein MutT [Cytobacillus depressus]|uniref:DNA mismatch repair protein MutT n=1 Tax=Cytobacillus depressus TaxID=1602942 RepID=A0A6L3V3M3_9BACI|nr:DNA mismatch repair protein MutT [Cytobacillus depressus]
MKVKDRLHYAYSTSFITDTGENVVDVVFLCEHDSGEAFPKSPNEVAQVLWLSAEDIFNHPKSPIYLKESIKRAESLIRTYSL